MTSIQLTPSIAVPDSAIVMRFVRSSGPGGQNVNKVATAVELRFSLNEARLPHGVRSRLERLVGNRLTQNDEIIIFAQRFRSQNANREDALTRLASLLNRAEHAPKRRIATRPTQASKRRRREFKTTRSTVKRLRGKPASDD